MNIHSIALPTPFPVGDVNVYLIAEDPLTLIDTGPKTSAAMTALREGLRALGFRLADVRRIVLTHAHEDHCGLTKQILDETGDIPVLVHEWETGNLFGRLAKEEHLALMTRAGVSETVFAGVKRFLTDFNTFSDTLPDETFTPLQDEMEIEFESGNLRVLHTPGHTPGSCSLLREANRTVIAGDCILKRITPNPILTPDPIDPTRRYPSLAEYLVSLARIRSFAPTLVLGGHGEPVTDYEELFNRYVRAINERQAKTLSFVTKQGITAWKMAQQLFPDVVNEDVHRFLAVSEAVAHLDLAESENRVAVELRDGVEFYRKH